MASPGAGPSDRLEFHDFQLSPLSRALATFRRLHPYLRRHVRNWVSVDLRYLRRVRSLRGGAAAKDAPVEFRLELRGTGEVLVCRSIREYHFFVEALVLAATILGEQGAEAAAATLVHRMQAIRAELERVFTREEIDRVATGGYPALKEIVLYLLVRKYRPESLLETGVAQGVSSSFLLEALAQNGRGHLTSIDLPNYDPKGVRYQDGKQTEDHTYVKKELGTGWLVTADLRQRWELLEGASSEVLPRLDLNRYDLFFHDSEHSYQNMLFEYRWGFSHLRPGGLLISDDIHWNTAFPEFTKDHASELRVIADRRVGVAIKNAS